MLLTTNANLFSGFDAAVDRAEKRLLKILNNKDNNIVLKTIKDNLERYLDFLRQKTEQESSGGFFDRVSSFFTQRKLDDLNNEIARLKSLIAISADNQTPSDAEIEKEFPSLLYPRLSMEQKKERTLSCKKLSVCFDLRISGVTNSLDLFRYLEGLDELSKEGLELCKKYQQTLREAPVAISVDPYTKLQGDLTSALKKLIDDSFSALGKEKRQQKANVINAALLLVKSRGDNIEQFADALKNNPDYAFAFTPGKVSETLRLVREVVQLYPTVRQELESRREKLRSQQIVNNDPSFFARAKARFSPSGVGLQMDALSQAVEALQVPSHSVIQGIVVQTEDNANGSSKLSIVCA